MRRQCRGQKVGYRKMSTDAAMRPRSRSSGASSRVTKAASHGDRQYTQQLNGGNVQRVMRSRCRRVRALDCRRARTHQISRHFAESSTHAASSIRMPAGK